MEQYRKKRRRQAWLALGTLSLLWEIPAGLRCAITRPLISGWEIYDLVHSKWTYTKIGTIQRRLAWPLRKDDTQIREAFQIFWTLRFFEIWSENSPDVGPSCVHLELTICWILLYNQQCFTLKAELKRWKWYSFCSSSPADSEYVGVT